MKCCICNEKEANVHLTMIVGDKLQKAELCEECARRKAVDDPAGYSLADLAMGMGNPPDTKVTRKPGPGYDWNAKSLAEFLASNNARLSYYVPRADQ